MQQASSCLCLANLCFPVIESKPRHGFDAQQMSAENIFGPKLRLERLLFFEIFKELDAGRRLPNGILGRVCGPDKLLGGAERLVPQGHGGVDNVLAVAAYNHKPMQCIFGVCVLKIKYEMWSL